MLYSNLPKKNTNIQKYCDTEHQFWLRILNHPPTIVEYYCILLVYPVANCAVTRLLKRTYKKNQKHTNLLTPILALKISYFDNFAKHCCISFSLLVYQVTKFAVTRPRLRRIMLYSHLQKKEQKHTNILTPSLAEPLKISNYDTSNLEKVTKISHFNQTK